MSPDPITVDWDVARAEKGGFDTFMLKEIHEQPSAIRDTLVGRVDENRRLVLDDLRISDDVLREVDKVFVVACGTAYHSGLVAKYAIEHWTRLPVEIDIASEFRYRDPVLGPDTLTLAVSQSGETIDTLEAARHARRQGSSLLAVTNTVGSSLAREADGVIYMHAGPEIGVAATKTFATQMVSQYILAMYLAQVRGSMFPEEIAEVLTRMWELPAQVQRAIELDAQVQELAQRFQGSHDWLFIGRHTGFPAALEGALKLKEISYVHAEGYPAGELKHGPIALVEDGVPVVAVATKCHVYPKMLSNIQEVRARGAEVIAVATEGDEQIRGVAQHVLEVPETPELLSPVVVTVPLQLLAYHVARLRAPTSTSRATSRRASRSSSARRARWSSLSSWTSSGSASTSARSRGWSARSRATSRFGTGSSPRKRSPTATRRRVRPSPTRAASRPAKRRSRRSAATGDDGGRTSASRGIRPAHPRSGSTATRSDGRTRSASPTC